MIENIPFRYYLKVRAEELSHKEARIYVNGEETFIKKTDLFRDRRGEYLVKVQLEQLVSPGKTLPAKVLNSNGEYQNYSIPKKDLRVLDNKEFSKLMDMGNVKIKN